MRTLAIIIAVIIGLLGAACASAERTSVDNTGRISGVVQRSDGTPIADAWVVLIEEPKQSLWAPKGPRVIVQSQTDEHGKFQLPYSKGDPRRFTVTVLGEVRESKRKDGTIVVAGTDVPLKPVSVDGENMLIVPDDFAPLTERRKPNVARP